MTTRGAAAQSFNLVRGQALSGRLSPTVVGRAETPAGHACAVLMLGTGSADIAVQGQQLQLAGPGLAWTPWHLGDRMTVAPGAEGAYLLIGATTLLNAIGHSAETAELSALSQRPFTLPLGERRDLRRRVAAGLDAILEEQSNAAAAARTIIEAHLRILLVRLWRAYDVAALAGGPRSPAEQIFNQFNGLVEIHYRERWTVQAYAATLGVSRDRLIDICKRIGGRTPKALISARVFLEARLLLEHTTNSIEQIAGGLGFASASHFSHFFAEMAEVPPSHYRAERARTRSAPRGDAALFAWP